MQNIYMITVPQLTNMLVGLKAVLSKAEAFAKEKGMDEKALLKDSLAPDMFPLVKQVQLASDHAKGVVARLSGALPPSYEDTEETFAQLQERLDKTLAYLATIQEEDFAGAESRKIELRYHPGKYLSGWDYLHEYALPNFYFHVTTAYGIVRKNGTPVGKGDYLSKLSLQDLA